MKAATPYGSWPSPISAREVTESFPRLGSVAVGSGGVYVSEDRPSVDSRTQIMLVPHPGAPGEDLLPGEFSARDFVHEYGGGAWWLAGESVIFVDSADQRLWRLDPTFEPFSLSQASLARHGLRYADGVMTPDLRWTVCVNEVHAGEPDHPGRSSEPLNRLVAVRATGGEVVELRSTADFVSSPRIDRSGEWIAWIEWNHPDMPWDQSELWVARIDRSIGVPGLMDARAVSSGRDESVCQPEWDDNGHLWFATDRTGWWNLHSYAPGAPDSAEAAPTLRVGGSRDIGFPHWQFGESRYGFLADGRVVFAYAEGGVDHLGCFDPILGEEDLVSLPYASIRQVRTDGSAAYFIGSSHAQHPTVVKASIGQGGAAKTTDVVARSSEHDASWFSPGRPITFPTAGGAVAHGVFYAPLNESYEGLDGELPPLIVAIHGGPTAAAAAELSLRTQYWTSRGFAYVDVNYRGSTGFGREYRNQLRGQWGVADVEDCVAAATFLVDRGDVDGKRLLIRGSSAGGFTALSALCSTDLFAAGASLYGVAELEALARDTHKFESRYLDGLIAPYPEGRAVYEERSPLSQIDSLNSPLIVFQGLLDTVVPPAQAHSIVQALREKGIPHAYVEFTDEAHGFRKAPNAIRCLEAELSFYAQVLGFPPPEGVEPVEVHNRR